MLHEDIRVLSDLRLENAEIFVNAIEMHLREMSIKSIRFEYKI